jgi:hypothetical protein
MGGPRGGRCVRNNNILLWLTGAVLLVAVGGTALSPSGGSQVPAAGHVDSTARTAAATSAKHGIYHPVTVTAQRASCDSDESKTLAPLRDYLQILPGQSCRPQEIFKAARSRGFDLQFIVATLPDPIDSRFAFSFDQYVESIEAAVQSAGFVSDRVSDVWAEREAAHDSESEPSPATHGGRPSLLLFRREAFEELPRASDQAKRDLLLTFLVGESPTWGVQKPALATALELEKSYERATASAAASRRPSKGYPIRILGPSSSGATDSLRIGLREWFRKQCSDSFPAPVARVELISGSATSPDNLLAFDALARELPSLCKKAPLYRDIQVTFRATLNPDDLSIKFALDYLRNILKARDCDIALLTEGTTDYGQDAGNIALSDSTRSPSDRSCQILQLPFPLHLGQLRTDYNQKKGAEEPKDDSAPQPLRRLLDLSGDEGESSSESAPSHSRLTKHTSEIGIDGILRTLSEEKRRYVGVVASDPRDVMFLVERIRRAFPSVLVFVFSEDLLYLHDDALPFMQGTLVVSSYPLLHGSQRFVFPLEGYRRRLLFPSDYAEGVFNAMLSLMDDPHSDDVLDYGMPFVGTVPDMRPALWLSVISDHEFQPVYVEDPYPKTDSVSAAAGGLRARQPRYVQSYAPIDQSPAPPLAEPTTAAWRQPAAVRFNVLGAVFFFIVVSLSLAYLVPKIGFETWQSGRWRSLNFLQLSDDQPHRIGQSSTVLAIFVILLVAELFRMPLSVLELLLDHVGDQSGFDRARLYEVALCPELGLLTMAVALSLWEVLTNLLSWTRARSRKARAPAKEASQRAPEPTAVAKPCRWERATVLALAAIASSAVSGWLLTRMRASFETDGFGRWGPLDSETLRTLFFFERARALDPGSSLVWFVALMTFAYLVWALGLLRQSWLAAQTKRLRQLGVLARDDKALGSIFRKLGLEPLMRSTWEKAEGVLPSLPTLAVTAAAIAIGATFMHDGLVTIEGHLPGSRRIWLGTLCQGLLWGILVFFMLWISRFLSTWRRLRGLLEKLAASPLAEAFGRIPSELLDSFNHPWGERTVEILHAHATVLVNHYRRDPSVANGSVDADFADAPDAIEAVIARDEAVLAGYWEGRPPAQPPVTITLPLTEANNLSEASTLAVYHRALPDARHLWLRLWEESVAIRLVIFIEYTRSHLYNFIGNITISTLPVMAAASLYPFVSNRQTIAVVLLTVLAAVAATVTTTVQMNRDWVLSRIAGTTPSHVTWDRGFVTDLVLRGALPILGVLAIKFPGMGRFLTSVVEPVLKVAGH